MRFLITGGAGFIGSHLANYLHREGHYVRVLDDMSSGSPDSLHPDIFVKRGDVRDVPALWSLLHGVDVVYHLAALVSVPASILYPRDYNDVNVGGTVSLLEACRDVGVGRIVLASSATVYGEQPAQPVIENAPCHPTVPYAVTKVAAEHYLFTMGRLVGFETVSLRIFNAYGPGQALPPTHAPVIPYIMQQVVQNASVVVYGDGKQSRDFVYIDDVVKALAAAAIAPNVDQQTINVGSGAETSINELATIIGEVVGKKARLLHNREMGGGVDRLVANIEKAETLLDFQPKISLKKGLQNLYKQDPIFRRHTNSPPGDSLLPSVVIG
jgi:UDP-glucose 4-epimerase